MEEHALPLALNDAFDLCRDGIVVVAPDGRVRFANRAWRAMHGLAGGEDATGDPAEQFHTQVQRNHDVARLEEELSRSGSADRRIGHARRDGTTFDAWTRASLIREGPLAGGRIELIREAPDEHELLRETNVFLDSIVENIPDMVFVKDARELRFVRLNRAGEQLVGHPREELLGKSDYDLFPPGEADFFTAQDRAALEADHVIDIPVEPIHTAGRGVRWLHTKKIPLRDDRGETRFLLGIAEDITDERLAIERQRVLAETGIASAGAPDRSSMVAGVARAVISLLADGCALRLIGNVDPSVELTTFAHRLDEHARALGSSIGAAPRPSTPGRPVENPLLLDRVNEGSLAQLCPSSVERMLLRATAASSAMVIPLRARGLLIGMLTLWYDVSARNYDETDLEFAVKLAARVGYDLENARVRAELEIAEKQAQSALRVRDEFLSIASHELRTPLGALQFALQSLEHSATTGQLQQESVEKRLHIAMRQVSRLTRLLDDLLDVSRMVGGRLSLQRENVDLVQTTLHVVEQHRAEAQARGCDLRFSLSPCVVGHWDPLRIEQVITNLLSNAIKYAPRRPIEICVEGTADRARLVVRDHGPGISEEDLERIFERFERASPNAAGGLGLGLFITRQIVEAHGGSIRAANHREGGAELVVDLPT